MNPKKMKINLKNLVPKDWTIEKVSRDKIRVYYINKGRGNSPKRMILPKTVDINKEFIEAISMYLGDGKLSLDDKHLSFTSIDSSMVKFMLDFFMNIFGISLKDMTLSINCKKFKNDILKRWSQFLNIPYSKFRIQTNLRSRNEGCDLQISSKVFRIIFGNMINKIKSSNFLLDKNLRISFLRGLFAAEGNVGIDYLEKKPYISQITFNLSIKEEELCNLISKALKLEGISYKINKRYKTNSQEVVIQNWNNYWKLWKINLFDLCKRKKTKFLIIMKNLKIYCIMNNKTRMKFFNSIDLMQKEIANLIGSWQGNVSKTIKGIHLLTIERVMILQRINNFPTKELKNGIKTLRIGTLTEIREKEFKDFIWNFKATNF